MDDELVGIWLPRAEWLKLAEAIRDGGVSEKFADLIDRRLGEA